MNLYYLTFNSHQFILSFSRPVRGIRRTPSSTPSSETLILHSPSAVCGRLADTTRNGCLYNYRTDILVLPLTVNMVVVWWIMRLRIRNQREEFVRFTSAHIFLGKFINPYLLLPSPIPQRVSELFSRTCILK